MLSSRIYVRPIQVRIMFLLALFLGLSLWFSPWPRNASPVRAAMVSTITVTNAGDGAANAANCPGTGTSCRLRDALAAVSTGGTINFNLSSGTTITLTISPLVINKNVTIQGPGATALSVSGGGARQIFQIAANNTATLNDLKLTGGKADNGGAIRNEGTLNCTTVTFDQNSATNVGGAIYNTGNGRFALTTSIFTGNQTIHSGGAIYNDSTNPTPATISRSRLNNNFSVGVYYPGSNIYLGGNAGAIFTAGNLAISRTMFGSNRTNTSGGAIYNTGSLTVADSFFELNGRNSFSNENFYGGAIRSDGSLQISNTTFLSNDSLTRGGAVFVWGASASATIVNSTFSRNSSSPNQYNVPVHGAAVAADNGASVGIYNCTAAEQSGAEGFFTEGGAAMSITNSISNNPQVQQEFPFNATQANNLVRGNPQLLSLQRNGGTQVGPDNVELFLYPLGATSPAINAGDRTKIPLDPTTGQPYATDQRGSGFARVVGSGLDIGAFERQNTAPALTLNEAMLTQGETKNVTLGSVADPEDRATDLTVSLIGDNPSNGVTLSNLQRDSQGQITATLAASCQAAMPSFTLRVEDLGGQRDEKAVTVTVNANPGPTLSYPSNPGTTYGTSITVNPMTGPNSGITSIIVQDIMPTDPGGITVDAQTGIVTVASTVPAGDYTVTIRASNACAYRDASFPLGIARAPLNVTVNNAFRNQGEANPAFSGLLTGLKNNDPITASYSTMATTSSVPGDYLITATLNDPNNRLGNYNVTNPGGKLTVFNSCGITVNPATLPAATRGVQFVQTLSGAPTGSYTFSLLAGQLPPGISLVNVLGIYSLRGTPTAAGVYTFTIKAKKNNSTCEGARTYTITVP